eukprot:823601-Amphidinium_carterae.1
MLEQCDSPWHATKDHDSVFQLLTSHHALPVDLLWAMLPHAQPLYRSPCGLLFGPVKGSHL